MGRGIGCYYYFTATRKHAVKRAAKTKSRLRKFSAMETIFADIISTLSF